MTKDALKESQLGNLVIIKGTKKHVGVLDNAVGQIVVDNAKILQNLKGEHEYSTESFKSGKDLSYFKDLNKNIDHSTTSYTLEVTIKYVGNQFYSRYDLYDEVNDITMPIYCSNASQLTFLEPYKGQKVTIDFTVVN